MAGAFARIVVAGALFVGWGGTAEAVARRPVRGAVCDATASLPPHIRTTSCDLTRAIALGMSSSPSFRQVVERVAELHGIVYLTAKPVVRSQSRQIIDGTVQHHVTVAGSERLLFVTVTPYSGGRAIPLIAHELQHSIEVLESTATSEREIDDLFERIGERAGVRAMETAAALAMQAAVATELAKRK